MTIIYTILGSQVFWFIQHCNVFIESRNTYDLRMYYPKMNQNLHQTNFEKYDSMSYCDFKSETELRTVR
jgi:hypothetical protein